MREYRTSPGYIKSIEGRTVTGIFSVFGNVDQYNDKIWPGAFAKTFAERGKRVLHLWQHDFTSPPTARVVNLREVTREELPPEVLMRAPDALGGAEVIREYLDTPRGNEVLTALKAGSPLEMSFAFDAVKFDFEELADAKYEWEHLRNLRELRLYETSDVLWGANDATVASKNLAIPVPFLLNQLRANLVAFVKAGSRNSTADQERINDIARLAVELGATNCTLKADDANEEEDEITDDTDKSRAAATPEPKADEPAVEPAVVEVMQDVVETLTLPRVDFALRRKAAERALVLLQRSSSR